MNEITVPEKVKNEIETRLAWAQRLTIKTEEERALAGRYVKSIKTGDAAEFPDLESWLSKKAEAEKIERATKDAYDMAHAPALFYRTRLEMVNKALRDKIIVFEGEQEKKRLDEQRRIQAEVDERDRKKRERMEREAARLKTPELRAERLAAAAAVTPPVVTLPPVPKRDGASIRKTTKARIVDRIAFIRAAVGAGRFEFIAIDDKALQDFARRTKGDVPLTGVEFYEDQTLAVRQ